MIEIEIKRNFDTLTLNEKLFCFTITDIVGNIQPILKIISHVEQCGCKTLVIEHDYVDEDFLSEYSAFYSKSLKRFSKYCKRVHFFALDFESMESVELKALQDPDNYIGYTILRPIEAFKVSRTVLKPIRANDPSYFVLCSFNNKVNLIGRSLEVNGAPFFQQDQSVGSCAQAALWMMNKYMSATYGSKNMLPSEITEAAIKSLSFGQTLPNRKGLHHIQMSEVIRATGFSPVFQIVRVGGNDLFKKKMIYYYVESGLPVLLGVYDSPDSEVGHMLTCIGHTYKQQNEPDTFPLDSGHYPGSFNYFSSVSWVDKFIVHNDNLGPYLLFTDADVGYSLYNVEFILVALPKEVYLDGREAETIAINSLTSLLNHAGMSDNVDFSSIVFRTYLRKSNQYKKELDTVEGMSERIKKFYKQIPMSKYIWISELNDVNLMNEPSISGRKIIGEIIVDATANPLTYGYIAAHTPGVVFLSDRQSENEDENIMFIHDDDSYQHYARI